MKDFEVIARYEGYTIQEAKLTYAARQKLPDSAFCGPNRSYPAHDARHVRNGLARLSTFGHRLKPTVRQRIYRCLVRRAKRFGIEHDPSKYKWGKKKKVQETEVELTPIAKWYLSQL